MVDGARFPLILTDPSVFLFLFPTTEFIIRFYFVMIAFWLCFTLVFSSAAVSLKQNNESAHSEFSRLYHKPGNVTFVGIFEDRFGFKCSEEIGRGLEEIVSAIWTVEALNKYQYLPGITIGMTVFGICKNLTNEKPFIRSLNEHLRSNDKDNYFGILTTSETVGKLPTLERFFEGNLVLVEHIIDIDIITDATVQLLINLQWLNINKVISDSANTLQSFKEKASEEGLFIQDELLMHDRNSSRRSSEPKASSLTVFFGKFSSFSDLEPYNENNTTLLLTPTDFLFDVSLPDLQEKHVVVSMPPLGDKTVLSGFIKSIQRHRDFFSQKPPAKGPLFVGTAATVLKLLKPIKAGLERQCQYKQFHSEGGPCASVADFIDDFLGNNTRLRPRKSIKISPHDVEETLKVLKIEPSPNDEMFMYITSVINGNASEDVAIFQIYSMRTKKFQPILLMIDDNPIKNGDFRNASGTISDYWEENFELDTQTAPQLGAPVINLLQKFLGHSVKTTVEQSDNATLRKDCPSRDGCPHPPLNLSEANNSTAETPQVSWRFLTWVSVNTSLSFVGVTCTLSAMLFVIIRLCRDDILEGSPFFTLLLMISVVFTYFSSLPFHLEFPPGDSFVCVYRTNGPPAVFALLFSLLLSRSLVLAFSENGGDFVTHINGYLQAILCFFMVGVQVSVISQNWIAPAGDFHADCTDAYDKYKIIFSLGYDFLLLILLACVSPFIIRSKQNYKEGLLFSISVFFITVVWSAWISFYVLLPTEHKDAALAIGLNSTASVLLFCIFIPQMYFMSAPFPQNGILRSLSPLDGNALRDVNFKSNQALNDSAFGTITYRNEMGVSNPNFQTNASNVNNPVNRETALDLTAETSQPN